MPDPSLGTIIPGLPFLPALLQDNFLYRVIYDALYPKLLYRMEAIPEKWEAQIGEVKIYTRSGLMSADVVALDPDTDPTPENEGYEQWMVKAAPYGKTTNCNLMASRAAIDNLMMRKAKTLGLNAGQVMNRLARNKLFRAYCGGHTVSDTTNAATVTVAVPSINGFTQTVVDGALVPVGSGTAAIAVRIGAAGTLASVIGATASDATKPFGRGTLTFAANVNVAAGDAIVAVNAPQIVRAGGGLSVDAIANTDLIRLTDVRRALTNLRNNDVPVHADGYYHVHLDPTAQDHLFSDPEVQNLVQGVPGNAMYRDHAIGFLLGAVFYSNNEAPGVFSGRSNVGTTDANRVADADALTSNDIGAEVVNATGVPILRSIVTGGGSLYECYIPEAEYLMGVDSIHKIGNYSVVNGGVQTEIDRVRHIIRPPLNLKADQVSQTWSWSGDFGVPSDLLAGRTGARYKRACVIESGVPT